MEANGGQPPQHEEVTSGNRNEALHKDAENLMD